MAEGNAHIIDPDGQARQALQTAVAEHGSAVLSNPELLDGICRDQLASLPGESILIGSAARSDVPALLRERTTGGRVGDDGVRAVAAIVSAAHGLDTGACAWVVNEFARILGYRTPGETAPMVAAATAFPGETGAGDQLPPGPAPARNMTTGSPGRTGTRRPSRALLGLGTAAALIALYLAIAAGTHLVPFTGTPGSQNSSPPPVAGGSPGGSPDVAADTSPDTAPDQGADVTPLDPTLQALIPSDVQSGGTCRDYGTPLSAMAAIECTNVQGLAAQTFYYYLFADTEAMNQGNRAFLANGSFQTSCSGSDGNFDEFTASCQSPYTSESATISGTVSEYLNTDNNPVIATTEDQQKVLCVMVGSDGGDLLSYWSSMQWIVTGT